jgi:uncharacterized membrane protein
MKEFGLMSFLWRWIPAFILLSIIYNPTGYSYYHWVADNPNDRWPLKLLIGLVLAIGVFMYLAATYKSLKVHGVIIIIALFAALLAVFHYQFGWTPGDADSWVWIGHLIGATILAVGMSWSGIWRRMTGQVTVDDGDDVAHH